MADNLTSDADVKGTAKVPELWSSEVTIDQNPIRQLLIAASEINLTEEDGRLFAANAQGKWEVLKPEAERNAGILALRSADDFSAARDVEVSRCAWAGPSNLAAPRDVLEGLEGKFRLLRENTAKGIKGLRAPQVGAAHSIMGYWTLRQEQPATVVMPTGTGKTETMLSLFAAEKPPRLLVLVPSDALREQLSRKFETFGVLQEFGIVAAEALRPIVGRVAHAFTSRDNAKQFAGCCNVIVATPQALNESGPEVRSVLLSECTHLFVDEAHHIIAPTWRQVRDEFSGKPIVQFTATPFREDGHDLGGKLVYVFPLRDAQEQGYFSKINYSAVIDFQDLDGAIAARAVELLRADLDAGRNHLLMARVSRIGRAKDLLPIYEQLAPDLEPVILHSGMKPKRVQQDALKAMRSGDSRIIICVNMLGEGFDLPNLKVAAIHDPHKSLGVTLQFVGRFARATGKGIGEASVVVGRTDTDSDENLKRLYAEDPDWNKVINDLSAAAVGEQVELGEFEAGFVAKPEELSLRNINPRMSAVVYKTICQDWKPDVLERFFDGRLFTHPVAINPVERVAWLVTKETDPVRWGDIKSIEGVVYHLYVFHWDPDNALLYINSSDNDTLHEELAEALCGEEVQRIKGRALYRTMAKIRRRVPTSVGLLDSRSRKRSFALHTGTNVIDAFPTAEAQTKTQTNIFAYGFEVGERVSMGISLKGRVWSYQAAPTIKHWVDWARKVGGRLLDESINVEEVIAGFIHPQDVQERPALIPLALEWPWELYSGLSEGVKLEHAAKPGMPIIDAELVITEHKVDGPIPFKVVTSDWELEYTLTLGGGKLMFASVAADAEIVTTRKRLQFSDYLNALGLKVLFEGEAVVTPDAVLLQPNRSLPPFSLDKMVALDWTGIDLSKESQGPNRDPDSIQAKMIEEVKALGDWDIIVDDDASGEAADIVAVKIEGTKLKFYLVHCKFTLEKPGARVDDLYQVCGQAQKCIEWRRKPDLLLRNLARRERNRRKSGRTGLMVGSDKKLLELAEKARYFHHEFHVAIAQPGLSKKLVSRPVLDLLACTETYLQEVGECNFTAFTHS